MLEVCRSRGVPLLINDRVDIALAVGADGVHVGQVREAEGCRRGGKVGGADVAAAMLTRRQAADSCTPPPASSRPLFLRLQGDLPAAAVRRMIGPDAILGVSVKTVDEVSGWVDKESG